MTNQEAIEILSNKRNDFNYGEYEQAKKIAIECVEKQIPKKPTIEYLPLFKAYCPICEGRLLPSKWCAKCGQAILWESDNE